MAFWIIALILALIVAGLLARALTRSQEGQEHPAAYDLRVYRDQLKEIDKDVARGVTGAEDGDRLRAEVSRRILSADAQLRNVSDGGASDTRAAKPLAVIVALVILGGGVGLYFQVGAPGYGDLPLATRIADAEERHDTRPSQAEYEADLPPMPVNEPRGDFKELITKLRETVAQRPDDLEGQMLLARNEANLGNVRAAYKAQAAVLRLKGDEATAQDHLFYAELLINSAQGYVSPEAEAALRAAMEKTPRHPVVRYYWGLMLVQSDRPDLAFRMWERLLREGPADAPWIPAIRSRIEELAWRAGEKFTLPPEDAVAPPAAPPMTRGPSQEDMDNAAEMSPEDQQAMIENMVTQLSERLDEEGGSAMEWSQLISAYGVLGDKARAASAYAQAQEIFAEDKAALAILLNGAARAGVAE
ncbi:MAG: c-type cytochrome biogenesis protein CcmI [Rhodobacteraceae bacterium]|nr:c-type cytochrome biogenesis protein CcmI [Paracoccaceae bacterium]